MIGKTINQSSRNLSCHSGHCGAAWSVGRTALTPEHDSSYLAPVYSYCDVYDRAALSG
jgi:hypothetical protein